MKSSWPKIALAVVSACLGEQHDHSAERKQDRVVSKLLQPSEDVDGRCRQFAGRERL